MGSGGDGCVLVIGMLGVTRFVSCGVCVVVRVKVWGVPCEW